MMRWIAGLAAVLLLPACGDGTSHGGRDPAGTSDGLGTGQSPGVRIVSPDSGASFPKGSTITIEADVTDPNASVARVEFYDDNKLIGSKSSPPYTLSYGPLKEGSHVLCAVAVEFDGVTVASSPVTILVVRGDGDADKDGHGHDRKH